MRLSTSILFVFVLSSAAPAQGRPEIGAFAWLQGCWDSQGSGTSIREEWMKPEGQTMLGMSRTVRGGKTVGYEFMRIWEDERGAIVFTSRPSGQSEASFALKTSGAQEAVFENLQHDFPQRIIYRRSAPNRLDARIEGSSNGKESAVDFPMTRAECAPR